MTAKGVDRHHVAQVLPVEIDLVDVRFQRQIERERVVVDDAVLDVIQLTWDT